MKPGSSNVVLDFVQFTMDIRSSIAESISEIGFGITEIAEKIKDAGLDRELLKENEKICKDADYPYCLMNSGAGHDTQVIAPHIPSVLVFVPCVGGRSHTPEEVMTEMSMMDGIKILSRVLTQKAW